MQEEAQTALKEEIDNGLRDLLLGIQTLEKTVRELWLRPDEKFEMEEPGDVHETNTASEDVKMKIEPL